MNIILTADRVFWANNIFDNADANQAIIKKRWNCNGNERELLACPQDSMSDCGHYRDAGVYCYGNLLLLE
jgi:hypothetical protein